MQKNQKLQSVQEKLLQCWKTQRKLSEDNLQVRMEIEKLQEQLEENGTKYQKHSQEIRRSGRMMSNTIASMRRQTWL